MVAKRDKIKAELANRGGILIFVGYLQDHADDVYQFYNPVTRKIIQLRDVVWLGKLYGEYVEKLIECTDPNSSSSDDHRMSKKLKRRTLRKMSTSYNPLLPEDRTFFGIA